MAGIGVVGLGKMGRGLAIALAQAGQSVIAWNRTPRAFDDTLEAAPVRVAENLSDVLREAGIVMLMLSDYEAAAKVVSQAGDISGTIVVGGMSGTPAQSSTLADLARKSGARYVDAAIKKGPPDFVKPTGGIFYAGDRQAFEDARPQLSILGGACEFLGSHPGAAKAFELATLARNYMWVYGYFHALLITRSFGMEVDVATKAMMSVSSNSLRYIDQCARQIAEDHYPASVMASTETHRKALAHVIEAAADSGLEFPMLDVMAEFMRATVDGGWGDRDMPAFFSAFEAAAKAFRPTV